MKKTLGTLGRTLNGDPCSLLGVIGVLPGYTRGYMVVYLNKGTPISTPIYYSPYFGDPQQGAPNFGKPPNKVLGLGLLLGVPPNNP